MKRPALASLAALATAGALTFGGAGMAAAHAGTVSASPRISNFKTYDNGTLTGLYTCSNGHKYTFIVPPVTNYNNNCEFRVILYQHSNDTGWHFCVNPHSEGSVATRYQDPHAIQIGVHVGLNC